MKPIPWILAALLAAGTPTASAQQPPPSAQGLSRGARPAAPAVEELRAYARREAAAPGLEDFEGGHGAGVILAIAVIAAIIILVALIIPW